jgi:hypothetical protein
VISDLRVMSGFRVIRDDRVGKEFRVISVSKDLREM